MKFQNSLKNLVNIDFPLIIAKEKYLHLFHFNLIRFRNCPPLPEYNILNIVFFIVRLQNYLFPVFPISLKLSCNFNSV